VAVVRRGQGQPVTLFAPGGDGDNLDRRMRYADRVAGTTIGFAYESSGHFDAVAHLRRQAERDAAEVRALAAEHDAGQAIGFSRGARAIVGALAEDPRLFGRVVLVLPPGGTAAGKYSAWLESRPGCADLGTAVLVIGSRGDRGHPARVAEQWAEQLGAHLELLPPQAVRTDAGRVKTLLADFLS
jgi:hypothetical protein